jgi:hypothetical protein
MLGLKELPGIAYEPTTDTVYVANVADGSVRVLRAEDFVGRIDLGDDADNVRFDGARNRVLVGYGKGEAIGTFSTQGHHANFPMAVDREAHRVLAVFRSPARLLVLSSGSGAVVADAETCGDADDVFVDAKRHRVYVIVEPVCVDVFEETAGSYQRTGHVATASGLRTSLLVLEVDRLFVAVRAAVTTPSDCRQGFLACWPVPVELGDRQPPLKMDHNHPSADHFLLGRDPWVVGILERRADLPAEISFASQLAP